MSKNLSKYTDEELAKMAGVNLTESSDDELAKIAGVELPGQGAIQKIAGGLATAGEFIDRFTGAPSRAGVVRGIESGSIPSGAQAFIKQFGAPPEMAPTEEETRKAIGIPEFPGSDFLTGVAVDWTNIAPGLGLATGAAKKAGRAAGILKSPILPGVIKDASRSEKLASAAEKMAIKQGGGMAKQWRSLISRGKDKEFGRFLIDSGLVKAGDDVADVYEKARALQGSAGEEIGSLIGQIKDAGVVTKKRRIGNVFEKTLDDTFKGKILAGKEKRALEQIAKRAKKGGPYDATELLSLRKEIDDMIAETTFAKPKSAWSQFEKGLGSLRNTINDEVSRLADKVGDPQLSAQIRAANKKYSMATSAKEMAQSRLAQTSGNMKLGALDYMTGVGASVAGVTGGSTAPEAMLLGLGGALGSAAARKYGAGMAMNAADLLSKGSKYSGWDYLEPNLPYIRRALQSPSAQARLRALEQEE